MPDLRKTALCEEWKRGTCAMTAKLCPYAHGPAELRTTKEFVAAGASNRSARGGRMDFAAPRSALAEQLSRWPIQAPVPPMPSPVLDSQELSPAVLSVVEQVFQQPRAGGDCSEVTCDYSTMLLQLEQLVAERETLHKTQAHLSQGSFDSMGYTPSFKDHAVEFSPPYLQYARMKEEHRARVETAKQELCLALLAARLNPVSQQ